jgi:hypothetical protein
MRDKVAAAVIAGLLAGLIPAAPAVAHRSKCLPGKVSHKGCHKVWNGARRIGVPKKTIRKKIFRHPRRIATVPIQWKRVGKVEHFKHYGATAGDDDRSGRVAVEVASYVLNRECLIGPIGTDWLCPWGDFGRAPTVRAAWLRYIKTWRWSKRCCWVKKRSVLDKGGDPKTAVVEDVTAIGAFQGWDYKGIVGSNHDWAARQFRAKLAKRYWHWSWIQPRWQVCFLRLAVCYEDKTPRLELWAGWGGDRRKLVDHTHE